MHCLINMALAFWGGLHYYPCSTGEETKSYGDESFALGGTAGPPTQVCLTSTLTTAIPSFLPIHTPHLHHSSRAECLGQERLKKTEPQSPVRAQTQFKTGFRGLCCWIKSYPWFWVTLSLGNSMVPLPLPTTMDHSISQKLRKRNHEWE